MSNEENKTDTPNNAQNENHDLPLTKTEKTVAGVLMILGIIITLGIIIIHWPNKMPTAEDTIYIYEPFQVTLIENCKKETEELAKKVQLAEDRLKEDLEEAKNRALEKAKADKSTDSAVKDIAAKKKDSADIIVKADMDAVKKAKAEKDENDKKNCATKTALPPDGTIQFGALILILVAASGFLGNMVYVASSFTAFVGSGKFKRSWIMWYIVKPFTASGLAVFLYLALNSTIITAPINLNGILAAATFAGLFTDIATLKLKEIFTVAFKPIDNRTDKLTGTGGKQTIDRNSITPEKIDVNNVNNFLIPGQNLDPKNIAVTINNKKIEPAKITITPTLIKFNYNVPEEETTLTNFTLVITDSKGVEIDRKEIGT